MMDNAGRTGQISFEQERGVAAVETQTGFTQVLVEFGQCPSVTNATLNLLKALREEDISVDLLKLGDEGISFVVVDEAITSVSSAVSPFKYDVKLNPGRALVSIVAANMREMVGVMAIVAECCNKVGANVEQTGDAHDRVTILTDAHKLGPVVTALKEAFGIVEAAR
jgi:aspartate kinase